MEIKSVGEIVRKAEQDDIDGQTTISKYVQFEMRKTIDRVDAYINSKHISGDKDALGRDKPFFNIVTAARNIWYRATDIDRKNIRVRATRSGHYIIAFLATILLQEWMRKAFFGKFLNEWGRTLATYGSAVSKFVEKDGDLFAEVTPWNRLIVDAVDFDNNVKIERLWYTPAQLLKKKEYDQEIVNRLLDDITARETADGQKKDNKNEFIPVYEVHGEMPLSYLTENEEDDDEYVQQIQVITFLEKKDKKNEYEDYALFKGKEAKASIADTYQQVKVFTQNQSDEVQGLMTITHNYFDKLYMDRAIWKIGDIFEKAGELNQIGRRKVESLMKVVSPEINRIFSTQASIPGIAKIDLLKKELNRIKSTYSTDKEFGIKWYQGDDTKVLETLDRALDYGKSKDSFMNYLDNYRPRSTVFNTRLVDDLFSGSSVATRKYIHERVLSKAQGEQIDFMSMVMNRTQNQAKEMFVDNSFREIIAFAKTLPPEYKDITHHYLARLMNLPSQADVKAAGFLQASVGRVERAMGKSGIWDARRAMQVSKTLNDFTYMAFLGFKPFSAMRNMFQPLVMVPADLGGGARGFQALAKGYKMLLDPKTGPAMRKYLKDSGAITEFIPEFEYTKELLPFKKKIFGKEVSIDDLRDWSMVMFKRADRYNRYVAGSSAVNFWDEALVKVNKDLTKTGKYTEAGKERLSAALRQGDEKILNEFYKAAGINGRRETIKDRLKDLIEAGRFEEAKKMFVTDIVSDTQYLYGHLDSPLFLSSMGAVGKNATIFQSWWMNYGTQLHKWATTGEGTAKFEKAVNLLISSGMAYLIMRSIWSQSTASKTVLMGPFPDPSYGIPFPPTWKPFLEIAKTAYKTGEMLTFSDTTSKDVVRQAKRALGTTVMTLTPGGLQLKQSWKGLQKEGLLGLAKSIPKFNRND